MKKRWLLSPDHDGMFTDLAKSDLAYSNLKGEVVFLSRCKQQIAPNQNSTCFS